VAEGRLGGDWRLEQRRTVGGRAERTRRERWSGDESIEVKKSGFASEPRRAGDKDTRGGARGRPRRSSGRRRVAEQLAYACEANDRAPFKWRRRLTSGPLHLFDLSRFSNTHILIFELVTFLVSKFCRSTDWNTRSNLTLRIKFKIPKYCKL
jgi:hypothetical protein